MIKKSLPCSIAVKGYTAMTIFPLPVTLGLAITPPAAAVRALRTSSLTLHSGFKWLKPAKNKLFRSDFTNFSRSITSKLHHFRFRWLHIQILSNWCKHKCDQSLSQILIYNFWRIFVIWNLCTGLTGTNPTASGRGRCNSLSGNYYWGWQGRYGIGFWRPRGPSYGFAAGSCSTSITATKPTSWGQSL